MLNCAASVEKTIERDDLSKEDSALDKTLADLRLTVKIKNRLVREFLSHPKFQHLISPPENKKKLSGKIAQTLWASFTLRAIVEAYPGPSWPLELEEFPSFKSELRRLKLTDKDWAFIASPRDPLEDLRHLTKTQIGIRLVRELRTLSGPARKRISHSCFGARHLSIAVLLQTNLESRGMDGCANSIRKTQEVLRSLGFTEEESIFLRWRPKAK